MNDVDEFFAEQDRRMNIPDEDVDEYIQTRLTMRKNHNRGPTEGRALDRIALHSPISPQRRRKRSLGPNIPGENSSARTANARNELDSRSLPGPSFPVRISGVAAELGAKRRKITGERSISISKLEDGFLPPSGPDGLILESSTLKTTTQGSGAFVNHFPAYTSVDPVGRMLSPSRGSGRNSMSSSTHLLPECDRDLLTPFVPADMIHPTDQAVPITGGDSTFAISEMNVVQTLTTQKLDTPLVSIPDSSPVAEVILFPPASSRHITSASGSTTFDGHGSNNSGFLKSSLAEAARNVTLTAVSENAVPSSSRITDDSHEASHLGKHPVSRKPAGFNTAAYLDASNITSPADMSGQNRLANESSHESFPCNAFIPKGPMPRRTVDSDRKARKKSGNGGGSKKVKDKPKLVTPLEYAQKLQSCLDIHLKTNYLKGKCIFYIGGDMTYASSTTRGRMEYIVKHGGTLVPRFDSAIVTHIVTDAGVRHTLQALSLKSLSEIPDNIPTVTWNWVVSGYRRARKRKSFLDRDDKRKGEAGDDTDDDDNLFDFEFMHAAFSERIDAGCNWKNMHWGKQNKQVTREPDGAHDDSGDVSHISTFSQESRTERRHVSLTVLPPPPLNLKLVGVGRGEAAPEGREKATENDPLSEYYAQARAEREAQWNRDASDSEDGDNDLDYQPAPAPRRGFTCDLKGYKPTACVNQHIVDKLEELRELHKAKSSEDDRWRAYSYGKCIPAIRNYPKPIRSFSEARTIRGVGERTALKIMEIINTGDLKRITYENTEDVTSTRTFQGIYGVGRHTAFAWFASGVRTLDDVRARKGGLKLSTAQEIGLKFYDDINSRMPREEAKRIFDTIKPIALAIDSELFIEIMGSYRRGKADCGDIDIMITRPTSDGKTHQGVLRTLLEKLHAAGIITEDLAVPDDFSDLELIYRGLCKLPESGAKRRRIDFLCVPWTSRGAALLYYTGDDIFNRAMRLKANRHGYSLNQRGLYAGVVRDPRDRQKKVCGGHIVASETEEEIFRILGVPWQEPHERVRG